MRFKEVFMEIGVIGMDLAKSAFHLVGMDRHGTIVARKQLSRSQGGQRYDSSRSIPK
jgi:predicted GNAT family N-acyltransferase